MRRARGAGSRGGCGSGRGLLVVGKGLSRCSTSQRISRKNGESVPALFERNVQEAINNYSCETLSSLSSSGRAASRELNSSCSGINSCTTYFSTERSSVYSWRDDEFDKANTQRVHQLFWEIDEMLFEGKVTSQTQSLQAECTDWVEQFPHLRVLGKQLLLPQDEGFQHFQSSSDTSGDPKWSPGLHECTSNIKELCISGSKLIPTASPIHKLLDSSSTGISASDSSMFSFLEEEIYDVDGKIEEYLAFDNEKLDDESWEQKKIRLTEERRSKRGIPPVSPNACIKDAVASEVFDCIWSSVIGILEELIKKNWETSITEGDKQMENLKPVKAKLPHLPVHITSDTGNIPLSRDSEARIVSSGSHFVFSQVHRFSSNFCNDLNGVMTIQAKPLQQRHVATVEKIQSEQDDKQRSIGSARNSVLTRLGRIVDNSVLLPSRVRLASSGKLPSHCRLPSLTSDQLSSKAPKIYEGEILKGTKLGANLDRLSFARTPVTRNRLPPINSEAAEQYLPVPRLQQSFHRGRYAHSRISSAVPGNTEQQPLRERTVTVNQFSRPNTTHTFRTDIPQKIPLTPMDFANHRGTDQGFLIGLQHYHRSFQRNPPALRKRFQIAS